MVLIHFLKPWWLNGIRLWSQQTHLQTHLFDVCDGTPKQRKQYITRSGLCSEIPKGLLDVTVDSDHHKYQYVARHISFTVLKNIGFNYAYVVNLKKFSVAFSYRYSSFFFISSWWRLPGLQFIVIHDTQIGYKIHVNPPCWSSRLAG